MASKDSIVVSGASSTFHALLKRALKARMKNDRSATMAYVDCIAVLKQDEGFCAALTPVELSFDTGKLSRNFKIATDDYAVIAVSDFDWCAKGRIVKVVSAVDGEGRVQVEVMASSIYGVVNEKIDLDGLVIYKKPNYSSSRSIINFIEKNTI